MRTQNEDAVFIPERKNEDPLEVTTPKLHAHANPLNLAVSEERTDIKGVFPMGAALVKISEK